MLIYEVASTSYNCIYKSLILGLRALWIELYDLGFEDEKTVKRFSYELSLLIASPMNSDKQKGECSLVPIKTKYNFILVGIKKSPTS